MRDPRNYFLNLFDSDAISFDDMAALSTDHIGKLGNQNTLSGGLWAVRLAATVAAMAEYDDTITDEMVQGNFRKARKQAKNDFRESLPAAVRAVAKWVEAEFGENSPELISVVGSGTSALHQLRDDQVENYLQTVIVGLTPLIGNGVLQARLDDANALKAQWDTIYAGSEQSTASKRLTEGQRREAKRALADVLFVTFLEVVMQNRGRPEVVGDFFTPSLAGGPALSVSGGGSPSGGNGNGSSSSSSSTSSSSTSSSPSSSSSSPSSSSSSSGLSSSSSSSSSTDPGSSSSSSSSSSAP